VLSKTEQVWRHLIDGAHLGKRRWSSASDLGRELGIGTSTVMAALEEPRAIDAVSAGAAKRLMVTNPWKLLVLWAARRDLAADIVDSYLVPASVESIEMVARAGPTVLGGCGAVVDRLGANHIADYSTVLVYDDPDLSSFRDGDHATEVLVARPDPLLRRYGSSTTLGQSWVDLFRLPGWQSAQFVHDLIPILSTESEDALLHA
jgi:hypothetical protein